MPGGSDTEVVVTNAAIGLPERVARDVVQSVLRRERRRARIAVTFLGPRAMRHLNAQFLQHDYATDVIAFPLAGPRGALTGDIYICRYAAARNARARRTGVRDELMRLLVHGTLHVLGWEHPEGEARERSPMWRRQEKYLRRPR